MSGTTPFPLPPALQDLLARNSRRQRFRLTLLLWDNMATWSELMASLRWLEAEGFIEIFYDKNGNEVIRIAEGAEDAKL